jgi:DEAD/DEAH box helicase
MADAAERKRKRLEAWRKRQQEQLPAAVTLTLSKKLIPKKKKLAPVVSTFNAFGEDDEDGDDDEEQLSRNPMLDFEYEASKGEVSSSRRRRRWDVEGVGDALDSFMDRLQEGATGSVSVSTVQADVSVNVGGSMMRLEQPRPSPSISGQVVTDEQLASFNTRKKKDPHAHYTPSDWESEAASEADTEDDEEEDARRSFMEALKSAPMPMILSESVEHAQHHLNTAAEVRTEKQRREDRLKQLENEAEAARHAALSESEFGRLYNDGEDGIMEEAERNLDAAMATPDALEVLAELNKKKELKSVDHSQIDYIKFRKNLYIVPRSLANLPQDEVINRRAKLKIRVRGKAAPVPVSSWTECGLSERIIKILNHQQIHHPYAIQAQCIPCIMAGRDVIGIAKTGSGKTLAYLLPLLRHIGDQPPLGSLESGPIGLILAPARELAAQIHSVCKVFCKSLGFK